MLNDLIWIGVVLRAAKSVNELPVVPEIVQQARSACRELRLVAKPKKRTRRPTADELKRLREHFKRRDRRATILMLAVMEFAIASARRESEICRLEWRGRPNAIRCDNGPEYISSALQEWATQRSIRIDYIQPGKPQQNAYVERFNRTVRYEQLTALVSAFLNPVLAGGTGVWHPARWNWD